MLLTHCPEQRLQAFVEGLWYYDGGSAPEAHIDHVLPNGKFQIVIGLAANVGVVSGLRSQHVVQSGAVAAAMGVVFRPGGARGFFAFPANDFFDRVVSLDAVWHAEAPSLRDRLQAAATP